MKCKNKELGLEKRRKKKEERGSRVKTNRDYKGMMNDFCRLITLD
jgi:hypothetical protein